MKFTEEVIKVLNKFPEVSWDRFTGESEGICRVFGWFDSGRNGTLDFLSLDIEEGKVYDMITSSDENSEEFYKRLGLEHIERNKRIADYLDDSVRTINYEAFFEKKVLEEVVIPITYLFDRFKKIGYMKIQKEWFEKISPQHYFAVEGKFTNRNIFKALQVSLVPKP